MKQVLLIVFCLNGIIHHSLAQEKIPKYHIRKAVSKITLDGKLDETDWQSADKSTPFWQSHPYDTTASNAKTDIKLTFDDNNLYVGATCYQRKGSYIVQSLRRDFGPGTTDLLCVIFDTFDDQQNAFSFAVSPLGVQREGLIANGNEFSTDWDNRWFSEVNRYDDYYVVEIAIPFKTLRYKVKPQSAGITTEGVNVWNMNFLRFDQSQTPPERSAWAFLPRFSNGNNTAFMGKLIWTTPPPQSKSNIALIPYVLGGIQKDYLNNKKTELTSAIGLDAKVAVTSSLNLDLTVNPDFAQVDVDRQQTNLSRFELFFPERRQFFLENSDLFGRFGFDNINPFFSRRIGLNNGNKVPIIAGARLTGKLDNNWRVGLMSVQTDAVKNQNLRANNFFTAAVQRKIFSRSNIGLIYVNRETFKSDSTGKNLWEINRNAYNRVIGLDYNLMSKDGKWQGKAFYHRSITPANGSTTTRESFAGATSIEYGSRNFNFTTSYETVGRDYKAEVGYVPRNNYYRTEPNLNFVFYPKQSIVNLWTIGIDADFFWRRTDNLLTDYDFSPIMFGMTFQNNAKLNLRPLRIDYTYLFEAFDPTNTGGKKLPADTAFTYLSTRAAFSSDTRQPFFFSIEGRVGKYFNGNIRQFVSSLSYRYQPYGVFGVNVTYNRIRLPDGFNSRTLLLIGPRFDLSFTRDIFFSTYIQYNNQINNVNLNARFQWRFAPVSDLFVVYTDNYFATDDDRLGFRSFQTKNRGVILKCTYWLNL